MDGDSAVPLSSISTLKFSCLFVKLLLDSVNTLCCSLCCFELFLKCEQQNIDFLQDGQCYSLVTFIFM